MRRHSEPRDIIDINHIKYYKKVSITCYICGMKRMLIVSGKGLAGIVLFAVLALLVTSVSPIFTFETGHPFEGPDIFNPYRNYVDSLGWKRANFHTHTRVKGPLNECEEWPEEVLEDLEKFGYDIVTFSNHNELTAHPRSAGLQVNVYEHGYNLFKYHKLVFGSDDVNHFDNLLPLLTSQRQWQLDLLGADADFIQLNHPFRTNNTSEGEMSRLEGYRIMELDSGVTTEQDYWDWALSAGHYSFALANDDLHYPDRSGKIAVRCNWLNCASATYEDIKACLLDGCYWCMRVPDYGDGDWDVKYEMNRHLPMVDTIGLKTDTVFMRLDRPAEKIVVTGQGHTTLYECHDTDIVEYKMLPSDPYARLTAYFADGAVIYSNPFARYDSSREDTPYQEPSHTVNLPLTILFNLLVLALICGVIYLFVKLFGKKRRNDVNLVQ